LSKRLVGRVPLGFDTTVARNRCLDHRRQCLASSVRFSIAAFVRALSSAEALGRKRGHAGLVILFEFGPEPSHDGMRKRGNHLRWVLATGRRRRLWTA